MLKKIYQRHYFIWIPLVSILIGWILGNMDNPVLTQRGQDNVITINNVDVIEQEIYLKNTDEIIIDILNYSQQENSENGRVMVSISQNGMVQEHTLMVQDIQTMLWGIYHFKLDKSLIKDGAAILKLWGSDLEEQDNIQVLVSINGDQPKQLLSPVRINSQEIENGHLNIQYDYVDFMKIIKISIYVMIGLACITAIYLKFQYILRGDYLLTISVFLIGYYILKYGIFWTGLNAWCTTPYMLNYKYGFISRGMPGTILWGINSLIGIDYISAFELRIVFSIMLIALTILTLKFIKSIKRQKNESINKLAFLYICSPFFITFYYATGRLGRLDVLLLICFLLSCMAIVKDKFLWSIPILSIMSILTHQIYIFTYLPVILILMFHQIWMKKSNKYIFPFLITTICSAILGVYVQFFSSIKNIAFDDLWNQIQQNTDAPILDLAVKAEQYWDSQYFTDYFMRDIYNQEHPVRLLSTVILLIPMIGIFIAIWKKIIHNQKEMFNKLIYGSMSLCICALIPIFFTAASDWSRWIVQSVTASFFTLFVLGLKEESCVIESLKEVEESYTQKYGQYWWVIMGVMLISYGVIESDAAILNITNEILGYIKKLLAFG